jgi:hypothetical protein
MATLASSCRNPIMNVALEFLNFTHFYCNLNFIFKYMVIQLALFSDYTQVCLVIGSAKTSSVVIGHWSAIFET